MSQFVIRNESRNVKKKERNDRSLKVSNIHGIYQLYLNSRNHRLNKEGLECVILSFSRKLQISKNKSK